MEGKSYVVPEPVLNQKETTSLAVLTERYNKLITPGVLAKTGSKIGKVIPEPVKKFGGTVKDTITEAELFAQCMKVVVERFNILEKQAARLSISEATIVKKVNKSLKDNAITSLQEVCLARGYDISKEVESYKSEL